MESMTGVSLMASDEVKKAVIGFINNSFVFYATLLLTLIGFVFISDFNGLYGQDAHEYFRYSKALHGFFVSGKNPGDYFWPVLYPLIGSLLSFILPNVFAMQIISILSLIFSCFLLEMILMLLYQKETIEVRIYVLIFFFLSPYILRASLVIMSDMLALTFILAAFYFFFKHWYYRRHKFFVAFAGFATAAVATRYASFLLLVIPSIIILTRFVKSFNLSVLLFTIAVSVLVIIPHLLIRYANPVAFLSNNWLGNWSLINLFRSIFTTQDGHAEYLFPNVIYSFFNWFHPAFLFVGILLIVFVNKIGYKRNTIRIILGSVFLYAIFIGGIPYQNMRFLILSFPLILIILFPSVTELFRRLFSRYKVWVIGTAAAIQIVIFARVFIPFYHLNKLEKTISASLRNYPKDYPVYTFEMEGALRSYNLKNEIYGLWNERYRSIKVPAMLLFNEEKLSRQWEGTNVMYNYGEIKKQKLTLVNDFGYGWQLSKVE